MNHIHSEILAIQGCIARDQQRQVVDKRGNQYGHVPDLLHAD